MPNDFYAQRRQLDFKRFFFTQVMSTIAIALLAWIWRDALAALSALLGGMVSFIPSWYFVWRGTRGHKAQQRRRGVGDIYQAAMGKFGLTVALFAVVFVAAPPSNPIFFFVAYVVAQLAYWLTPWLVRERSTP